MIVPTVPQFAYSKTQQHKTVKIKLQVEVHKLKVRGLLTACRVRQQLESEISYTAYSNTQRVPVLR